jgi:hypothetical protein
MQTLNPKRGNSHRVQSFVAENTGGCPFFNMFNDFIRKNKKILTIIIVSLFLGFLANFKNCLSDKYCESDPLYGGCPESCEFGSFENWLGKSFGLYWVLQIGSYIEENNTKQKFNKDD